jgi:CheY-like chemotaxis protein
MVETTSPTHCTACVHCRTKFDAFEAVWCSCIGREPTIVCPSCLQCLCTKPASIRQSFWDNPPANLWERRLRFLRGQIAVPERKPPPNAREGRPTILIVDDSRVARIMTVHALDGLDAQLVEASDGLQGLELALELDPHVIVADAFMPKLDGREVCEGVKRNPATRHTKVVIVTALYTAPRYKSEAHRRFNADEYLVKPVDQRQLHGVVSRLLITSRDAREREMPEAVVA